MFRAIRNVVGAGILALVVIVGVNVYGNTLITAGTSDRIGPPSDLAAAGGPAAKEQSLGELLQTASVAEGQKVAKKCLACHTFTPGAPAKVGPNLRDTIGAEKGKRPGFTYSAAMTEKGGAWTYADLDTFLTKPSAFVPGTKMTFAGLPKAKDRAAVIAYLASVTAAPPPFPAP